MYASNQRTERLQAPIPPRPSNPLFLYSTQCSGWKRVRREPRRRNTKRMAKGKAEGNENGFLLLTPHPHPPLCHQLLQPPLPLRSWPPFSTSAGGGGWRNSPTQRGKNYFVNCGIGVAFLEKIVGTRWSKYWQMAIRAFFFFFFSSRLLSFRPSS